MAVTLTEEDVKKVAHLARLALSDKDIPKYTQSLSSILTLVDQLNEANTDDVEPMSHPLNLTQPTRIDEITETNQRKTMQAIAPKVEAGLYLVPKVIE